MSIFIHSCISDKSYYITCLSTFANYSSYSTLRATHTQACPGGGSPPPLYTPGYALFKGAVGKGS